MLLPSWKCSEKIPVYIIEKNPITRFYFKEFFPEIFENGIRTEAPNLTMLQILKSAWKTFVAMSRNAFEWFLEKKSLKILQNVTDVTKPFFSFNFKSCKQLVSRLYRTDINSLHRLFHLMLIIY